AGIGVAFRRGLEHLAKHNLDLNKNDWIVLAATDLPFGFSDLEALIYHEGQNGDQVSVYVGSKAHPESVVVRDWKRKLATLLFYHARNLTLGLNTKDPQGSIFI